MARHSALPFLAIHSKCFPKKGVNKRTRRVGVVESGSWIGCIQIKPPISKKPVMMLVARARE
jgi:hypothetical protein